MGKAIIINGDFSTKNLGKVTLTTGVIELEALEITNKLATITNSHQLIKTLTPANTTQTAVVWESSNLSVATISPSGLITVLQEGEVTITCRSAINNEVYDSFTFQALIQQIEVNSIELSAPKTSITVDEQLVVTLARTPSNAVVGTSITYTLDGGIEMVSSSNTQVVIRGTQLGAWSITATSSNGKTDVLSGSTNIIQISSVSLSASKAGKWKVGDVVTVTAAINPSNADKSNFTMSKTGIGTITGQTQTSLTITVAEEGVVVVNAYDGETLLATASYTVELSTIEPNLVYELDAQDYISGALWTPAVGGIQAPVLNAVKDGDFVAFIDTNDSYKSFDSYLRVDLSSIISNTGSWSIIFEGEVEFTTTSDNAYIISAGNGTAYQQHIAIMNRKLEAPSANGIVIRGIGDSQYSALSKGVMFVNKAALVKNGDSFDAYSLNADNSIISYIGFLKGSASYQDAFMNDPGFILCNRRLSDSETLFNNKVKNIKVFNVALTANEVAEKFGGIIL